MEKIEKLYNYVAGKENISREDAKKLLHLYVCRGKCSWYKHTRNPEEFNPSFIEQEKREKIEQYIKEAGFRDLEETKRLKQALETLKRQRD